jgi:hypothetical protein
MRENEKKLSSFYQVDFGETGRAESGVRGVVKGGASLANGFTCVCVTLTP